MATISTQPDLEFHARHGDQVIRLALAGKTQVSIGRRSDNDLELPGDERVSRLHARARLSAGRWLLSDPGSKHGTWLNGLRLTPEREAPLRPGDVIVISPWTVQVKDPNSLETTSVRLSRLADDSTLATMVSRVAPEQEQALAQRRLQLLLDCASGIHAARDEAELAERLVEAAGKGSGYANAAVIRQVGDAGDVEILAHRGALVDGRGNLQASRTLIERASAGEPVRLTRQNMPTEQAVSIMQLAIDEALCVPMMFGERVGAFLYLDNRGGSAKSAVAPDAASFATGVARIGAMAMESLRRLEMAVRYAELDAELSAGAEAQRWIMPRGAVALGAMKCVGRSRPGRQLGGDFFDVLQLDDRRLAVALGDVSGKGAPASVLMTAAQGYLHAALRLHGDAGRAVTDLNRFIEPRKPENKFLTLWLGVFDIEANELRYVDAGHGHAVLRESDGSLERLREGDGILVGVDEKFKYQAVTKELTPGALAVIVSDGLVEQPGAPSGTDVLNQFGMEGLEGQLLEPADDLNKLVEEIFSAVEGHAGTPALADDATAVVVRW